MASLSKLLISVFSFFLCLSCMGAAQAAAPVKIAMITAKTGEAGKSNSISFAGARFAVEQINKQGGILGRPVELLEYDNLSTAEGSASAGAQAVKDGAVAVVGCNWSSHSLAMAKVLQKAGVPMISHMSTNPSVTRVGDYIFRSCFTDSFQGLGLARFSRETLRDRTAVVMVDEDRTYSQGLAETFTEAFEKLGGKILWVGKYDTSGKVNWTSLIDKIVALKPDALFVPGGYADVPFIFGGVREKGYKGNCLSGDGVGVQLYDYIGDKANGIFFTSHWNRWVDTKKSKEFVRLFESKYGPANVDTYAQVYDCFMLLKDAMTRADSVDGARVRDAMAKTVDFEGVTGKISFNEYGDPIKPMVINKTKFGGLLYVDLVYP